MAEPVVVRFHRSLYARPAIERAMERFAALGVLRLEEHDSDWLLFIEPSRPSLADRIGDEIANHVLVGSVVARSGA